MASAATAVVIGYVAGGTHRIRVGSGGIMLPNHAPLQIAEQFGTLDALFPGRIDLALGRAPGTDQTTAHALRRFRNHGITSDHFQREEIGSWLYEMVELGFNYRLSDMQCALGLSQLRKLPQFIVRRRAIAQHYLDTLAAIPGYVPLQILPDREHAWHLFVVRLPSERWSISRREIFEALKVEGIVPQIHYRPVHLQTFYRQRLNTQPGLCPQAEAAYEQILSLPLYPSLTDSDVHRVIETLERLWKHQGR